MATNYNPSIVTSGLALSLDAGNVKSYPGGGATWTDLSGNSNTGTLNNSPSFSSNDGGYFNFNGSTQYVSFSNSNTLATAATTIEIWLYVTSVSLGYQLLYGKNNYPKFYLNNANLSYYNGGSIINGGTIPATTWKQVVMSSNSSLTNFYTDGALNGTAAGVSWSTSASTTTIGKDPAGSSQYFSGRIAALRVYNVALTADQILQNYNALRGRFGL